MEVVLSSGCSCLHWISSLRVKGGSCKDIGMFEFSL
jgi:hypothetical protein